MIFLAQPYDSTDATRPYFFTISRNFVAFHTKLFEIFFKLNYLFIHKFPAVVLHTWFWVLLHFYLFFPWNVFYNIIFGYPLTLIDHLPWMKRKTKMILICQRQSYLFYNKNNAMLQQIAAAFCSMFDGETFCHISYYNARIWSPQKKSSTTGNFPRGTSKSVENKSNFPLYNITENKVLSLWNSSALKS